MLRVASIGRLGLVPASRPRGWSVHVRVCRGRPPRSIPRQRTRRTLTGPRRTFTCHTRTTYDGASPPATAPYTSRAGAATDRAQSYRRRQQPALRRPVPRRRDVGWDWSQHLARRAGSINVGCVTAGRPGAPHGNGRVEPWPVRDAPSHITRERRTAVRRLRRRHPTASEPAQRLIGRKAIDGGNSRPCGDRSHGVET
ncbi:hypothetical protein Mal4_30500 [Maioricimonas rarisocia]|uniref:Uncharacterized protein n=1 Tax=Maioricimonas rarisocia TaxID=2528026 RepID=A0A517Z897_9PLAN|nr:hypothetical protein Mal4_30500 [Maioricimonas rarisocia]